MAVVGVNKKKWGVKNTAYVSSQMCGRTTEVAAVGAWVQPGPGFQHGQDDVVVSNALIYLSTRIIAQIQVSAGLVIH